MKLVTMLALTIGLLIPVAAAAQKDRGLAKAAPAAAKIRNAEAAAPAEISRAATIMDWPSKEGGEMAKLREGTNGWVCVPDDPSTPDGNDPGCFDEVWQGWIQAYMARKTPEVKRVGVAYMIAPGGASASSKDPFAQGATADNDWGFDGPHTMILVPDAAALEGYPTDRKSAKGGPYVMWAGTPYAHIMMPVGKR